MALQKWMVGDARCLALAIIALAAGMTVATPAIARSPFANGRMVSIAGAVLAVPTAGPGSPVAYQRQPQRWSPSLLSRLRRSGFGAIRLVTTPAPLMADDKAARDRSVAAIDALVDDAHAAGLAVIVDMHFWPTDAPLSQDDVLTNPAQRADLIRGQVALARSLARQPAGHVALELFNEPGCPSSKPTLDWVSIQQAMVKAVRGAAPRLPLVLTGCRGLLTTLTAIDARPYHQEPDLYWTFHYYEPAAFVGQEPAGLQSVPFPPDPAMARSPAAMAAMAPAAVVAKRSRTLHELREYLLYYRGRLSVRAQMMDVVGWAKRNGVRPDHIFVGEFGAIMTDSPRMEKLRPDQLRWTRMMREEYERQHFAWGYFPMPQKGNINYDTKTDYFRADILGALGLRAL